MLLFLDYKARCKLITLVFHTIIYLSLSIPVLNVLHIWLVCSFPCTLNYFECLDCLLFFFFFVIHTRRRRCLISLCLAYQTCNLFSLSLSSISQIIREQRVSYGLCNAMLIFHSYAHTIWRNNLFFIYILLVFLLLCWVELNLLFHRRIIFCFVAIILLLLFFTHTNQKD